MKMNRLLMTVVLCVAATVASAQLALRHQVALPDSIVNAAIESVDVDNDGLPDLLILAKASSGRHHLMFIAGDTVNTPVLSATSISIPPILSHTVVDFDADNRMDVLLSTSTAAVVALNKGNFVFEVVDAGLPSFSAITFADFDNDLIAECVISGTSSSGDPYTRTYTQTGVASWKLIADSLAFLMSDIRIADFNRDGVTDIFLSTSATSDSVFAAVAYQRRSRFFVEGKSDVAGRASIADADHDGTMEVLVFGRKADGTPVRAQFRMDRDTASVTGSILSRHVASAFVADLNSDGRVDECLLSFSATDTVNIIRYNDGSTLALPRKNVATQLMEDLEHDGDLDLVQLLKHTLGFTVSIYENAASRNDGPEGPPRGIAVPVYDRTLFYWEEAVDDHTPASSLTYDLYVENGATVSAAEFDLVNEKRLRTSHGNNLTTNFRLSRTQTSGNLNYAIQSVDNALHTGPRGICTGSGPACVTLTENALSGCPGEAFTLSAPASVLWFSFRDGFLGNASSVNVKPLSTDTIFFLNPNFSGCSAVTAFPIQINPEVTVESKELFACEGEVLELSVPSAWSPASSWRSDAKGQLGTGSTIAYSLEGNDLVIAKWQRTESCAHEMRFSVNESKPEVAITPASAKITAGTKVSFQATGADRYEWSPAQFLNSEVVPDPTATPTSSIQYIVTGFDSLGCTSTATARIIVENSGFIPSLFTPNADGNNDELKIYGIGSVSDFQLRIFNREGNVVYSTRSVNDALRVGWDGTANGSRQPNGIYFWKVDGSENGQQLLLNGKKEGSFLLIR